MATTTFSGLSQRTTNYAYANALAHAEPVLLASTFGKKFPIPKNRSDTIKMRRVVPIGAQTTPLTEGVPPTALALSYEDVAATLQQYGMVIEITDKVEDIAEDPVLKDATAMCGETAGATFEAVTIGVLRAGTNVVYANKVSARNAVVAAVGLNDLRAIEAFLNVKKAKRVTKYVPSTVKTVSEPVRQAYIALCHSYHQPDLEQLAGWTPIEKYGDAMGQLPFEIGKVSGIRFCASPDMPMWADAGGAKGAMRSTSGTSADVYPIIIFGDDAYGSTALAGKKDVELHIHPANQSSQANPLGQKGTIGFKTWFAAMILNQNWIVRLETAVTNY